VCRYNVCPTTTDTTVEHDGIRERGQIQPRQIEGSTFLILVLMIIFIDEFVMRLWP
jgi:hypothetical protein